jgi:hypothetical protein
MPSARKSDCRTLVAETAFPWLPFYAFARCSRIGKIAKCHIISAGKEWRAKPDDIIVTTTYGQWIENEAPLIDSVRLRLSEIDRRLVTR